jgi:RNA polymerase sigma factor (sigma-70 family)
MRDDDPDRPDDDADEAHADAGARPAADAAPGDDDGDDRDADADDADDDDSTPYEPVEGDDLTAAPLPPAVIHRFLASPKALRIAKKVLRKLVPKEHVEDLASDSLVRALRAPPPHREAALPGWLAMVTRRRAIDWLRKRTRREKYEGRMPVHVEREDDYTGEAIDDGDVADTSYDPTSDETPVEILGEELDRFIGDNARDRDVRDIVREHDDGKTYAEIAAARGITPAQVHNRILRFKTKYAARVKRERQWAFWIKLAWWSGGIAVAAAVGLLLYLFLRPRADDIGPDPSRFEPAPSASASAPVFPQALPPPPEPSALPEPPPRDKPRAP